MGSGAKPKAKAQPGQVFQSGNMGTGAQGGGVFEPEGAGAEGVEELVVRLIHLDLDVLKRTSIGDSVSVDANQTPMPAITRFGRLGDVPQEYGAVIKRNSLFNGSVVEKKDDPPSANVVLGNSGGR